MGESGCACESPAQSVCGERRGWRRQFRLDGSRRRVYAESGEDGGGSSDWMAGKKAAAERSDGAGKLRAKWPLNCKTRHQGEVRAQTEARRTSPPSCASPRAASTSRRIASSCCAPATTRRTAHTRTRAGERSRAIAGEGAC
eukprot:5630628-Pleurochrysis_carterae.AAC.1